MTRGLSFHWKSARALRAGRLVRRRRPALRAGPPAGRCRAGRPGAAFEGSGHRIFAPYPLLDALEPHYDYDKEALSVPQPTLQERGPPERNGASRFLGGPGSCRALSATDKRLAWEGPTPSGLSPIDRPLRPRGARPPKHNARPMGFGRARLRRASTPPARRRLALPLPIQSRPQKGFGGARLLPRLIPIASAAGECHRPALGWPYEVRQGGTTPIAFAF